MYLFLTFSSGIDDDTSRKAEDDSLEDSGTEFEDGKCTNV